MNPRKQSRFNGSVIVALFISLISTFYLMPAASAQGTVSIPGTVDNLPVHPGDTISFTYAVSVTDPKTISVTVSEISTVVQLSVKCPNGSSQTITVNAPAQSLVIPANNRNWVPAAGPVKMTVPSTLCGGNTGVETAVTFTTSSTTTCNANSAQGCCHTLCTRFTHQHNSLPPPGFSQSCKPGKQCTSAQHGGCCP